MDALIVVEEFLSRLEGSAAYASTPEDLECLQRKILAGMPAAQQALRILRETIVQS